MTVENNVFTIKTKRKEHPNAEKYAGRPTMEFGHAFTNFLSDLSKIGPKCVNQFIEGCYVFEEEVSADFFDSIQVGDVVGLGIVKGLNEFGENAHKQPAAYKFKILEINKERDIMLTRNVTFEHEKSKHKGTELELTFEDFSCALGMGYGEILERDGKPYGVSEEIEIKVNIVNATSGSVVNAVPITTSPAAHAPQPATIPLLPEQNSPKDETSNDQAPSDSNSNSNP